MIQPIWYIKQEKERAEGKRHEFPCNGIIIERRSGDWDAEGEHLYWKECWKCKQKVDIGD